MSNELEIRFWNASIQSVRILKRLRNNTNEWLIYHKNDPQEIKSYEDKCNKAREATIALFTPDITPNNMYNPLIVEIETSVSNSANPQIYIQNLLSKFEQITLYMAQIRDDNRLMAVTLFNDLWDAFLCNIERICQCYGMSITPQPQVEAEPQSREPQLPTGLDDNTAKEIFAKAVEVGLMEQQGDIYRWIGETKTRKELAYFIKQFNVKILKKPNEITEVRPRYNNEKFIISPFEKLFNVTAISQEIQKPLRKVGYKKVDIFFNSL